MELETFSVYKEPIDDVVRRLPKAWGRETAYYDRKHWKPENPAWGQSATTALVLRSLYGGYLVLCLARLRDSRVVPHYYNRLPVPNRKNECLDLDATRVQFPKGTAFSSPKRHTPRGRDVKYRAQLLMTRLDVSNE